MTVNPPIRIYVNNEFNKVTKYIIILNIFMNSESSKTFDPYRLLLNLSDKLNLRKVINMLFYQILACIVQEKI